jgi:predicted GIY-YIG superfamily endonuclease
VSEFNCVDQAIAAEKKIKSWSHRKKRAFVDGDWEALKRYSRGRDRKRKWPSLDYDG